MTRLVTSGSKRGGGGLKQPKCLDAVRGHGHLMAGSTSTLSCDSGSQMVKVLPCPGSLSTPIFPPDGCTIPTVVTDELSGVGEEIVPDRALVAFEGGAPAG